MRSKSKEYYQSCREEMIDFLPSDSKTFLEVGCGEGNFGLMIKDKIPGSVFWGMELEGEPASKAIKKIDKVLVGNCEGLVDSLPDNFFDCIIFNDSLEHLVDPFSFLKNIKNKFKGNGYVVASIPNFRFYKNLHNIFFERDFEYVEAGTLDRTHLRFFTRKSIFRLFEEQGYKVEALEGINKTRRSKVNFLASILPRLFDDIPYLHFACRARLDLAEQNS